MSRLQVSTKGRGALLSPHKGLLLDKYQPPKAGGKEGGLEPLKDLCRVSSCFDAYKLAYDRWRTQVASLSNTLRITARVRDRLALGLGIDNVHEIGCRLHHTYGVPVIPGSSIRGILRSAVEGQPYQKFLFGAGPDETDDAAGFVIVHDAWWIPESGSGLAPDVVTVHHQQYYAGHAPPSDTDSPIPNHFLTITGKFLFVIQAPNDSWRDFLSKLLTSVLTDDGIGAKRAAGYGRFHNFQPL